MLAWIPWLTAAAVVPVSPVSAETPSVAVTLLSAAESGLGGRRLDLGTATFAGLPPPQDGLSFTARRLADSDARWYRVEVEARRGGRRLAVRRYALAWREPTAVVVTRRAVGKGATIQANDVVSVPYDGSLPDAFIGDVSAVIGQVARYAIAPGVRLRKRAVRSPWLIRRGDAVRVHARFGRFEVSVAATALTSGGQGASIRVKNERSRRVFDARVTARGEAEVVAP